MDSQDVILEMLRGIKSDITEIKENCKDRGSACGGRLKSLEEFKQKFDAVKDSKKDGLSWWALVIASVSGLLTIIINSDKVSAMFK